MSALAAALGAGVLGHALENVAHGPRRSRAVPEGVPFMPVYAAGGAAVALLAPRLSSATLLERAIVYGVTLTGIEGAAGLADRASGGRSWDYDGNVVDLPHALLWAGLGVAFEGALRWAGMVR